MEVEERVVQVEAWIGLQPPLDPRRLVPALLRCAEAGAPISLRQEAIRYVDFCIRQLESTEPAIHNLAVRPSFTNPAGLKVWFGSAGIRV